MAEVDTSIYNTPPRDPLGRVNSLLDVITKANEATKSGLENQGTIGLGKAIQDAIGPDGQVDPIKLNELLKKPENFPAAIPGAPLSLDLQGKGLINKGLTLDVQKKNVDLSKDAYDNIGAIWGARLSSNRPVTQKDLQSDVLSALAGGLVTKDVALQLMRDIPSGAKDAREFAAGGYLRALGPAGLATPAPATPGPGGEPRQQTMGEFVSGSLNGGAKVPGGGLITGLSPSVAAAETERGGAAAKQATDLVQLAQNVPTRKAQLMNLRDYAGQFTGGPMSDTIYGAIKSINEVFGTNIAKGEVASLEEFDKIATQIALAQSQSIGATDLTTRTAMGANPHSGLSNLGIKGILATLLGNEDAIQAMGSEFVKSGTPYSEFPQWQVREWNKNFDPRVFQSVYLTPEDRKRMLTGMNKSEQAAFRDKYNHAVEQGWIPDPRAAPGSP